MKKLGVHVRAEEVQELKILLVVQWKPAIWREPLINWDRCVTGGSNIVEKLLEVLSPFGTKV